MKAQGTFINNKKRAVFSMEFVQKATGFVQHYFNRTIVQQPQYKTYSISVKIVYSLL